MSKLPAVKGKEMVKFLQSKGFEVVGTKGSHVRLKKKIDKKILLTIVAVHGNKTMPMGTLMAILKQTEISKEELIEGF
ncbi:MAG: type II toxin-antitoxin system HicA family toxin [Candidatus Nanoarchaeia archaeon]|nr:type II toxin-antitoxin system HicA family toxin [Candidatus Nanoarchaeia archaeon]